MKRHPFLLFEVLIAAALVGIFAFLSIHGAFRVIGKQQVLLKDMQRSIEVDNQRMKVVEGCWNKVESYLGKRVKITDNFYVKSQKHGQYYLLEVEDLQCKESYKFLVTKQAL